MQGDIKTKLEQLLPAVYGTDIPFEVNLDGDTVNLSVPEEFMGIVIGQRGRHARALKELVYIHNKLWNTDYTLEILEPEGSERAETSQEQIPEDTETEKDSTTEDTTSESEDIEKSS